ncbi:MAG: hydroxymethylbilane synthase [Deltaproteobacteria bacterium]|nr:hydroxymethylbilane synthase [Deltaproteobacteria bacterium]
MPEKIRIGTRRSVLAMWQARFVAGLLAKGGMESEIVGIETRGDKILDVAIAKIGDKGVFTQELEDMLQHGAIDIAVHSAKDLPSELSPGFELIAFTCREKVNDVLVAHRSNNDLDNPEISLQVGSSSVRRRAFLRRYYPHFRIVDMRGNLQTRMGKMQNGVCDLLILAFAGVKRMEMERFIVRELPADRFVPPVGQGCLAVESSVNIDPEKKMRIRRHVNHCPTEKMVREERAFLKTLKGGCSIPAFGHATLKDDSLFLTAGIISLDGRELIVECAEGGIGETSGILGDSVARAVLDRGGRRLLEEIRSEQK